MYGSRAVTPLVIISDDVLNRILKLDMQTNVTRCCTDLTSKVLKERTFGQSSAVLLFYFDEFILILNTHNDRRKHIWSHQLLPTFRNCTEKIPPLVGLCRIRLHEYLAPFKRKNDVTPSYTKTDVILQYQLTSASVRFPRAFKTVTISFDIICFLALTL